ncbi:MAG: hypothetical protein AB8F34_12120 [Akkermansiaceae bacterium]
MRDEDWANCALFIWLSAYIFFFAGSCVLIRKKSTIPRWLIFIGTLFLVLVNMVMFAVYAEWFKMDYNPMYENSSWRTYMDTPLYPEWQRILYWGTALIDALGKILAGAGLIAEGRQQIAILRYKQMQLYQAQPQVGQ